MSRKETQEEWIANCQRIHNYKYTYEKLKYTRSVDKVEITCPEHGSFWQQAQSHKNGVGCTACSRIRTMTAIKITPEQFIERATHKHQGRYKYSLVNFIDTKTPVTILCDLHGKFDQIPTAHMLGHGCPLCANKLRGEKTSSNTEEFIRKAKLVHGDTYIYDLTKYVRLKDNVTVTCRIHSDFSQNACNHLAGSGCPTCGKSGYNRNKPAYLYILTSGNITKVGITNRTPEIRIKEVKNTGPMFVAHSTFYYTDGVIPLNIETEALRWLSSKYSKVPDVFQGSTECFLDVDLQELLNFVTPIATKYRDEQIVQS